MDGTTVAVRTYGVDAKARVTFGIKLAQGLWVEAMYRFERAVA